MYNTGLGHHQVLTDAVFVKAKGNVVCDTLGNEYIDWYTNESLPFGHDTSILLDALVGDIPVNVGLYENGFRAAAVESLAKLFPGYTNFQFNTSGTLANEGALRYAMAITGRSCFAGFVGSFHGRSKALASVTDMDSFNGERLEGYMTLPYPGFDPSVKGSVATVSDRDPSSLVDIDNNLREVTRLLDTAGYSRFAGVVVEPIQSKSVLKPPSSWLHRLKEEVLKPRGILMLADENFTSGRVGAWSSCVEQGEPADIITFSKSFSGGYPFGGVACLNKYGEATRHVKGGDAASAQAVQCLTVRSTVARLLREEILEHVQQIQARFLRTGIRLYDCPAVVRVAAYGALMGVEMVSQAQAVAAGKACVRNGILVAVVNRGLRLTPALNLTEDVVDVGVSLIEKSIHDAISYVSP